MSGNDDEKVKFFRILNDDNFKNKQYQSYKADIYGILITFGIIISFNFLFWFIWFFLYYINIIVLITYLFYGVSIIFSHKLDKKAIFNYNKYYTNNRIQINKRVEYNTFCRGCGVNIDDKLFNENITYLIDPPKYLTKGYYCKKCYKKFMTYCMLITLTTFLISFLVLILINLTFFIKDLLIIFGINFLFVGIFIIFGIYFLTQMKSFKEYLILYR